MIGPRDFRVEQPAAGRVAVHGDLDYANYTELDRVLLGVVSDLGAGDELVVDLAAVTYCDSCGLRVLLGAAQKADGRGARFVLRGAAGQPRRALRLTGLDAVLGMDEEADGADSGGPTVQA